MNKNLPFVLSLTANVILFLFCLVGVIVWKKDPGSDEPVSEPTIVADVIDEPPAILPEEAVVPVPEEEPEITDSSPSPSSESTLRRFWWNWRKWISKSFRPDCCRNWIYVCLNPTAAFQMKC